MDSRIADGHDARGDESRLRSRPLPGESLESGLPMTTFTLKVTLEGIRPPIWRRFVVPASISLAQLHRVLQIVMGRTDSHLDVHAAVVRA